MIESIGLVHLALAVLATIFIPAVGYIVRLSLVQAKLKTQVESMERRCTVTHSQLDVQLSGIGEKLERIGNEVSGLHAKVDTLIRLDGRRGQ